MRKYRGGIKEFFVVTSKEKAEKNWKKKSNRKRSENIHRERERERETKIKKQTKAFHAQISHCRWWFMTLPA